jgi:hypothetical protein
MGQLVGSVGVCVISGLHQALDIARSPFTWWLIKYYVLHLQGTVMSAEPVFDEMLNS